MRQSQTPPTPLEHHSPYAIEAILRACDVLESFRFEEENLNLTEIVRRTGLTKARVFRILATLVSRRLLRRSGRHEYLLGIKPLRQRQFRLGYATQSTEFTFSRDVTDSIVRACREEGLDLLVLDNRYSSRIALRNADTLIQERVDLVMEFQTDGHVAPVISSKFSELGMPLIAIEIPHPGATYYGANNYEAGRIGGRYLGQWAKKSWKGRVDEVLLLELSKAGALPRSRLTGTVVGIREVLPDVQYSQVVTLDGNGRFGRTLDVVRRHLRKGPPKRTLVGAVNDPTAIGALRAFEEAGASSYCAVMGQNGSLEARGEMRNPDTRLIGSVGYFPESYGQGLIQLALQILNHQPAPAAVFTTHKLITPANVDHFYPNDRLLHPEGLELQL